MTCILVSNFYLFYKNYLIMTLRLQILDGAVTKSTEIFGKM
jgi:hypothetical protein